MSEDELLISEKELFAEIESTLIEIAKNDPTWKLFRGREVFSATDLLQKLRKDPKLRKFVMTGSVRLAVKMWREGREKQFGEKK